MGIFMTALPTNSKSIGGNKKSKNIVLTMKPSGDSYYRFRLLAFGSEGKNDRDDPHIVRFVHQIWGKHPEKGYPVLEDELVCPVTPHVHVEGNRYNACKICDHAGKFFKIYDESNRTDKEAIKKSKLFGRKYQAIVPVYVVKDPVYEGNNNKFKVIVFNDKKKYEAFREAIRKASLTNNVFNGAKGVDCCLHVAEIDTLVNEGKPNQYTFKKREIDKIKFTTTPYEIPSITRDTVNAMGFDETFYISPTQADIDAFYKKHCVVSDDDIPDDDDEVQVFSAPAPEPIAAKTNEVKQTVAQNTVAPAQEAPSIPNDLLDDPDNEGLDVPSETSTEDAKPVQESADIDADALLAGLDL